MRSLFAKIFVCTLVIYPVSRSLGFLMLYLFHTPPLPRPPPPSVLQQVLPFYAITAMASLQDGGTQAVAKFLEAQQKVIGLRLQFASVPHGGCSGASMPAPGLGPGPPRPGLTVAVPVTAADGADYCLTALFDPHERPSLAFFVVSPLPVELACCALVSFVLARYLARPLRNLHDAATAFAEGDLSARGQEVPLGRRDDVAELVRAFNRMADHISTLIQAQQRFIADASHEIKSPLARIGVAAALARRFTSADGEEQFDRLERDIDTASSLVRELQILSSLQGAGTLPRLVTMNIGELLAAAVDNVAFERQGRPHGIRLTAPAEPVITLGDPALLQRAVENVLRNALFFTGEGIDVEMILARRGDVIHIEVRDHGPGVPTNALSYLFDPFYRVDESRTRNTGGVGIGLAIFKRAIVLHGGMATAENADPSGLRICIDLPLVEAG